MIRAAAIAALARRPLAAVALSTCLLASHAFAQTTCQTLGAHLSHTRASFARGPLGCVECHAPVCTPNQATNIVFGALARKDGAQPAWDAATRTCSGVYCHGATLAGAPARMAWSYVDPALVRPLSQECVLCHGYPPSAPHDAAAPSDCRGCHPSAAADGSVDVAGGRHLDGVLDVSGGGCGSCHGNPPATGAHVVHYGLQGGSGFSDLTTLQDRYPLEAPTTAPAVYAFGCGNCHPAVTPLHRNGTVDVVLYEPGVAAGTLKSLAAPTASYDPVAKTCAGVYCHSTGQAAPVFRTTPGWLSGARLGCDGCHDNPPAYASGGPGSATANSHLNLADDGYEFGHFLGMPGAWHTSKHGGNGWGLGQDASPITCQTCHSDTTDPANTGPSGFYYLDTTGSYRMPGGDPGRISGGWQDGIQCSACHTGGSATAPTGSGKVLPLRHVNGVRDVVFDARTALPPVPWLPAAPNTPTRPYWITSPGLGGYWPAGVTWDGSTLSFGLGGSGYDPATKTCTNVACHVTEQRPVWGTPYQYYTNQSATCYTCHPM